MKPTFDNWELNSIADILPGEFFGLIANNTSHIEKTFPMTLSRCADLEKTTDFIAQNKAIEKSKSGYYFYIRNLETQDLIGYVLVKNINARISKCELAYFIDQHFEGMGIISKAVNDVIDFCFIALEMNKVFICTSTVNAASQRIARKHGFQHEGILREEFRNGTGILEDIVYFGLLKSDYNER